MKIEQADTVEIYLNTESKNIDMVAPPLMGESNDRFITISPRDVPLICKTLRELAKKSKELP